MKDKRTYISVIAGSTPAAAKAAMNQPEWFRGVATAPGVQGKAPRSVIRREGPRSESPI